MTSIWKIKWRASVFGDMIDKKTKNKQKQNMIYIKNNDDVDWLQFLMNLVSVSEKMP